MLFAEQQTQGGAWLVSLLDEEPTSQVGLSTRCFGAFIYTHIEGHANHTHEGMGTIYG